VSAEERRALVVAHARSLGLCGEPFGHHGVCDMPPGHAPIAEVMGWLHGEDVGGPLDMYRQDLRNRAEGRA